ncbi:ankyrin repeat domain-containing protein [Aspergillus stella-maris]|uniref:ankyrin repeat domain-containing protein n=1 Tax=Aspergillus stella-maris TaxID=1810926 RepID=UPI003CCCC36C
MSCVSYYWPGKTFPGCRPRVPKPVKSRPGITPHANIAVIQSSELINFVLEAYISSEFISPLPICPVVVMLLGFPDEILLLISDELEAEADLSALSRTHPLLYCLLSDILHRNNVRYFGSSALSWAVRHNRVDTIERLLHFGADVNLVGKDNLCLLEIAACEGQTAAAELLLRKGAVFRGSKGQPSPPVCAAATMGNTEVLKVLIAWEETQEPSSTPDHVLHPGYSSYLFKQLFVPDDSGSYPLSTSYTVPLFLAIAGAHDTTAEFLIQHPKIDLNYRDRDQRVPLHWAISHGRDRIISALITQGADPNIPYPDGRTPLQAVVGDRHGRIASLLLGFDSVDPNCCSQNGHPVPLALALWGGSMTYPR